MTMTSPQSPVQNNSSTFQTGDRVRIAAFLPGHRENGLEVGNEGVVVGFSPATGHPLVEFEGWEGGHGAGQRGRGVNRWFIWPDCMTVTVIPLDGA